MCQHHSDLLGKDLSENYERERKYLIALVPFKYLSIVLVFFHSFAFVLDPGFYQFGIYSGMFIQSIFNKILQTFDFIGKLSIVYSCIQF